MALLRTPAFLAQSLNDARLGGYALGIKLVRGAYHVQENAVHNVPGSLSISPELYSPIWPTKADTDNCYNACVRLLLQNVAADARTSKVPTIGILFGSHNWDSVRLILSELEMLKLAVPAGKLAEDEQVKNHELPDENVLRVSDAAIDRITLGQLYGMSDSLTNYIVARTRTSVPFVIKYVPYGALSEVCLHCS